MILSTCPEGGIVLDPYCGLGTACKVAYDLHRRSIGIDVNEFYLRKAKETIQQQQLTLFWKAMIRKVIKSILVYW